MPVTTSNLFSIETVRSLVVEPVFQASQILPYLRRIDTRSTTTYLPVVSGGSANWTAELAPISEAGVSASELEVTPKAIKALQSVSNESAADANAAAIIGRALTDAISRGVDEAFVSGAGPTGPTGLPGIAGVSSVDGSPAALESYVDAIAKVQSAGGTPSIIFVSPTDWASLAKLPATTGSNVPALSPSTGANGEITRTLYGVTVSVVAALDPGVAWVVDGSRLVTVQRMPATVAVSDGSLFGSDGLQVRGVMRVEWGACYPLTICKIADVTP